MRRTNTGMRRLGVTALLVPALGLITACGGEDDSGGTAEPLPKEEFVAEADRHCAEAGEKFDALTAKLPPFERITAPDVLRNVMKEVGRAGPRLAQIERDLETELRALTPPADLAQRWDRALDTLGKRADLAAEIADAAAAGERGAYLESFRRFNQQGTVSTRELRGYGFEVCAVN